MTAPDITQYLGRQTLLAGDVNSGKTTRTTEIIRQFLAAGYARNLAILDLAPDPIKGVGGKLSFDAVPGVRYLTDHIAAPRLMGTDAAHTLELATRNARTIEKLFSDLQRAPRDILFINDATLYLQAGSPDLFLGILHNSSTRIINAYYGDSFDDSELSRRERRLTEMLMEQSDEVVLL